MISDTEDSWAEDKKINNQHQQQVNLPMFMGTDPLSPDHHAFQNRYLVYKTAADCGLDKTDRT